MVGEDEEGAVGERCTALQDDSDDSCRGEVLRLLVVRAPAAGSRAAAAAVPRAFRLSTSGGRLAAIRAVEEDPDGQILGEILEAMNLPGGREEERSGLKGVSRHAIKEPATPSGDDVDFVLPVRRLRVLATWGV